MSHTPDDTAGERQAPAWNIRYLPEAPVPFVIHFVSQYRWAYLAILLLQITAVVCTVLIPWSLGQVTRLVNASSTPEALFWPVAGFAVLVALEVVFTRSANTINIRVLPRQRARVTHTVYAYLQQHSHRFVSNEFAGALAHKVSEVAMGVNQTMNILLFDLIPLLVTLSLASLVLASASGLLAAFMLGWSVLFIGISFLLARRSHPLAQQYSAARSISTGKVVDAVTNLSNVRLFARHSHELDYLLWLGGRWRRVAALGGRLGDLEIASDDCWGLLLELEACPVATLQINYLDRPGVRRASTYCGHRRRVTYRRVTYDGKHGHRPVSR